MSLASLKADLNRLTNKKQELGIYRDKIISLGNTISQINTLEDALKIDKYYKIDDSSRDKIGLVKESISSTGTTLTGNTSISSAISVVDKDISSTKAQIIAEERRIREEEEARRRAEEEAKKKEAEANRKASSTNRPELK